MKRMRYTVTIDFEIDDEGAAAADSLFDAVDVLGVEFMVRATMTYDGTTELPQKEERQT